MVELQVLAVVAAAVLCALLGMSAYQQGRAHALEQAQHLRPVQARIVGQPYAVGVGGEMAKVSWSAADGRTVQGSATVPSSGQVGDQARIWLDAGGNPTTGPATTENTVSTAILTGTLALIGAGVVIASAGAFVRLRLNHMDETAWTREWQVYEPLWSRRR
uniref:Rv1733c family protein n=1 Tax=Streptacidiphilus rugosus TaxID=405783 RepID=UPI00055B952C|nr:hypothetical protein [Streptacidiphilus rugosus]